MDVDENAKCRRHGSGRIIGWIALVGKTCRSMLPDVITRRSKSLGHVGPGISDDQKISVTTHTG